MAAETSATSKRYVYVNSMDFARLASSSDPFDGPDTTFEVRLTDPIHDAHSVSMSMFVGANEYFNIDTTNNSLTFMRYRYETNSGPEWQFPPISESNLYTITLIPGFYTIERLVDTINELIRTGMEPPAYPFTNASPDNTDPQRPFFRYTTRGYQSYYPTNEGAQTGIYTSPGMLTGPKYVNFDMTGEVHVNDPPDVFNAFAGIWPAGFRDYHNSIWSRLGFTENQLIHQDAGGAYLEVLKSPSNMYNSNLLMRTLHGDSFGNPFPVGKWAQTLPYESHSAFLIRSNLVSGSVYRSVRETPSHMAVSTHDSAQVTTSRDDLLGIIPTNANIGSSITWYRPTDNFMSIPLRGNRPISHFNLSITNVNGLPFKRQNFANFFLVLEFTIVEHVNSIVERTRAAAQQKAFVSRHVPTVLGKRRGAPPVSSE